MKSKATHGKEQSGKSCLPESVFSQIARKNCPPKLKKYNSCIRLSNLPENIDLKSLRSLVEPLGGIVNLDYSKGATSILPENFAHINFENRTDATKAIEKLRGRRYKDVILRAKWAKHLNKNDLKKYKTAKVNEKVISVPSASKIIEKCKKKNVIIVDEQLHHEDKENLSKRNTSKPLKEKKQQLKGKILSNVSTNPHVPSVLVSNLPNNMKLQSLGALIEPLECFIDLFKGYAEVHFADKTDAARAIEKLNGYHYRHMILQAKWSKTRNNTKANRKENENDSIRINANPTPQCNSMFHTQLDAKSRKAKQVTSIRLSNLPKCIELKDLKRLVEPFRSIVNLHLVENTVKKTRKLFAYIDFKCRTEAMEAMKRLNGFKYTHEILRAKLIDHKH